MSKFKVIEESRFINNNEMNSLTGGEQCPGTHTVVCGTTASHGQCSGMPRDFFTQPCVANQRVCGVMTLYTIFCATNYDFCSHLQSYKF